MELDPSLHARLYPTKPREEPTMKRTTRRHAYDEGGPKLSELREAHGNLKEACDSLGEMLENKKFSFAGARDHCKAAMDHAGTIHQLLGGGETEDEDLSEEERDRKAKEARDGSEFDPDNDHNPTVRDGEVDHRKNFNSNARGGADSAMGYDVNALFQIGSDDPRYSHTITRRAKPKQRPVRPSHAHDTLADAGYDVDSLFQRDR